VISQSSVVYILFIKGSFTAAFDGFFSSKDLHI